MSIRCKISGCDVDPCGTCRRCGKVHSTSHQWAEAEREHPCYRRKVCERCNKEATSPDHKWEKTGPDGSDLKCADCGLTI